MKKKSGWIAFAVGYDGKIYIIGSGMYPGIYRTKRLALLDTHGSINSKIKPPQPVKIEWEE